MKYRLETHMIKVEIKVPEINTNTKPFLQKALRQSATYVR
jgi:hypothetical protein